MAQIRRWPHGRTSLAFRFDRDISAAVRWCLVDEPRSSRDIGVARFGRRA